MSARYGFAASATASLLLLFFLQLVSAQTDPAACSVSCRFVIVPTLGPQGLPGLNGTKGDTGANGQEGPIGPKGDKGEPGINGIDGIDGKDGINGTNGIDGKDGKDGVNGADGATGTFDVSSTYTGLKLEAPVLSGAISIAGAALSGATNIDEGATILRPNITGPIIDGATVIGEGATLAKPDITTPKISDAQLTGITQARHMVHGPDAPIECQGSTNETRLVLDFPKFGYGQIGSMIKWADGSVSILIDAEWPDQLWGTKGRINDEAVRSSMGCTLYNARNNLVSTLAHSNDGAPLLGSAITSMGQPVIHHDRPGQGARVVTLSLGAMQARNKAVWSFPAPPNVGADMTYNDTFVGKDMAQTVSNKVINASETNGHFRMKNWGSLGIADQSDPAAKDYTMINVTITGSLVTANTEEFYPSHTGSVLEWSDGAAAVIQTSGPVGAAGSTTFTAATAFKFPRDWQMVKWWNGNTILSNNFAVFRDKIALKALIGTSGSALTIDMTKMRVDAGVRHQTSWTFPHPGPAGQQNYFVGEESVQTLSNKKFDRIIGAIGASSFSVTSTTGSPSFGLGSSTIAGMIKANFQTPTANSIAWTLTLPNTLPGLTYSFLSLTPANDAAAALTGAQQVWVEHHNGGGATPKNVFVCKMGSTPLPTAVTYAWVYHVISGLNG